ncbi:MAG: hypothetical protein NTV46_06095 [Verrucomicrobia bacterium]|nr:hypothetical protein [Verrucomicrobiota bacterium]
MNRDCRHVISLVAIACCLPAAQGAPWSVTSPDGTLVLAADGGSSPNLRV